MKPPKSLFVCQSCGGESQKWLGRCTDCGAWNSYVEEKVRRPAPNARGAAPALGGGDSRKYEDVDTVVAERLSSGVSEFDRVLGGGIVPGSLVLLGGEPGIGKSTLLLQAAAHFATHIGPVLYCSGEESEHQIKLRGRAAGRRRRTAVPSGRDVRRAAGRGSRAPEAGAADRRFDPDRVLAEDAVGARQRSARCGRRRPTCSSSPRAGICRRFSSAT